MEMNHKNFKQLFIVPLQKYYNSILRLYFGKIILKKIVNSKDIDSDLLES